MGKVPEESIEMKKKTTIKDVAKLAGVSSSTVSRVQSGSDKISRMTKEKVLQAMKKLDYSPNFSAQSLAGNGTKTIAAVLHTDPLKSLSNDFFVQILQSICQNAEQTGYQVLLVFSKTEEEQFAKVKKLWNSQRVDGFLLLTVYHKDQSLRFLKKNGANFVALGTPEDKEISWVDNDNFKAMKNVMEALMKDGVKRPGLILGNRKLVVTTVREESYRRALKEKDLPVCEELIREGEFSEDTGYKEGKILLGLNVDAIVCADDVLAYGANRAMKEAGLNVPIVGFNNSLIGTLLSPPISSVDIQIPLLGKRLFEHLMAEIKGMSRETRESLVPTKLIKRK